jgi:EmrB/QacA subfamily drug resistance transporter
VPDISRGEEFIERALEAELTAELPAAIEISVPAGSAADEPRPGRSIVFGLAAAALFMASVDQTIVATALDSLQDDLHASLSLTAWTISIYGLGQIVAMPVAGRMSDMYGRRRIFLSAVVIFTVASLLCGLCTSIYELIPLRLLQALGGGAFLPSASGIVSDAFGRDRDRALGMFTSIWPIGGIAGPALGGVFVQYLSWRDIFLFNVPIGVVLLMLGLRFLPRQEAAPGPRQRIDGRGIVLLAVGLLGLMFGITRLGSGATHLVSPDVGLPVVVGVGCLAAFVMRARVVEFPVIPVRFLYGRQFGLINVINLVLGSAVLGFAALVPVFAQEKYGISPLHAGTLLIARSVGMVCVAGLTAFSLRRHGVRLPMILGHVTMATSLVLITLSPPGDLSPALWLGLTSAGMGIGMGMVMPASNNAGLHLAGGQIAAVTGIRGMVRQSGGIIALSATTAFVTRGDHPAASFDIAFCVIGGLVAVVVPLLFLVPDHRGRLGSD